MGGAPRTGWFGLGAWGRFTRAQLCRGVFHLVGASAFNRCEAMVAAFLSAGRGLCIVALFGAGHGDACLTGDDG